MHGLQAREEWTIVLCGKTQYRVIGGFGDVVRLFVVELNVLDATRVIEESLPVGLLELFLRK